MNAGHLIGRQLVLFGNLLFGRPPSLSRSFHGLGLFHAGFEFGNPLAKFTEFVA